jgi:probable F420-dependent oxidoreductase
MLEHRPFRFGIQLSNAPSGADWASLAAKAEDLGYSTLFLPDHFGDQLAPIPAMTAAADATSELRVGTLVFDNDYKHPVVLAKEVATIDLLSDGRVELGLGAGWMNSDYEQSGIPKDPARVRIDRMEEAITVIKGCFGDGPFDFTGDHYRISGLDGLPKPVQRPHPPLLIGGGGRRVLGLAGREAQIVGINPALRSGNADAEAAQDGTAEQTDEKLGWVREAAGDRFDDIELNMLVLASIVTDDRRGTAEAMAPMFGLDPGALDWYPHALIGPVEQMCDDLRARRERWGVSYWVFQGGALDDLTPVGAELAGT